MAWSQCSYAQQPLQLIGNSGLRGGLVIHVGATDGRMESQLANGGRWLVHGLALDESSRAEARRTILARRLYGLASVSAWSDRRRLPYAANLVTAVIADLDKLRAHAPSSNELKRIVTPEGLLIVRKDGRWRAARIPRPKDLDHWTHFDHGPDGNPVSGDTEVGPIRQQQWISGVQPTPFEGNPAGYAPGGGIRLWGRFAVMDVNDMYAADSPQQRGNWVLQCRDAFSGVPLWTLPRDKRVSQKRWSLVVGHGEVYTWLNTGGELTALDISTGKQLRTYPGTRAGDKGLKDETVCIRVTKDRLIAGMRDRVLAFERGSAKQLWQVKQKDKLLLGPVVDEAGGRVYCLVAAPGERREYGGRWPHSKQTEAVLAINLSDGKRLWQCKDVASRSIDRRGRPVRRGPGQIVPAGDKVIVFGSAAIAGGNSPYIAALDAKTGKVEHQTDEPFLPNYNTWGYNVLWRDGAAWFAGAFTKIWRFDPASAKLTASSIIHGTSAARVSRRPPSFSYSGRRRSTTANWRASRFAWHGPAAPWAASPPTV